MAGLTLAHQAGILPPPNYTDSIIQWFIFTCAFGLAGGVAYFYNQLTEKALERSRTEIRERERVEVELRKLTRAVEQSPASIVITDLNGNIEYVNPRFTQVTGYSPDDVVGMNPRILKTGLTPPGTYLQLWETLTRGKEWQGEFVNRKKDGALYYESAVISPITDLNGVATHYLAVKEDITGRKQAENALLESEEKFRAFIEQSKDGVLLVDEQGTVIEWNLANEQIMRIPRNEALGQPAWEIQIRHFPFKRRNLITIDLLKQNILNSLKTGQSTQYNGPIEIQTELPSGEILTILQTAFPIKTVRGYRMGVVMRDITKRKEVEESLRLHQIELKMQNEELRRTQVELETARNRYLDLYDLAPVGYITVSEKGLIIEANLTAATLLGMARSVLRQSRISQFILKEDQDIYYQYRKQILETDEPTFPAKSYDLRMVKQDKTTFWSHLSASAARAADGTLVLHVTLTDITERKQAETKLRENEERFRRMFEDHGAVMMLIEPETGQILDANHSAAGFYGYSRATLKTMSIYEINVSPPDKVKKEMQNAKHEALNYFIFPHRLASGDIRTVEVHTSPLNFYGTPALFSIVHDITERKQAEEKLNTTNDQLHLRVAEVENLQRELQDQAIHDPLTGLYNRRYLNETLEREIARAGRENDPISIIVSDIDNFKNFNDTYGHSVGDKFLVEIASLMKNHARGSDIVCRYGGEEFLLVLPGMSMDAAVKRAEEIRMRCAEFTIQHEGQDLRTTMSFGVASYPEHGQAADELIIKADKAMYRSKQTGRNRVTAWVEGVEICTFVEPVD